MSFLGFSPAVTKRKKNREQGKELIAQLYQEIGRLKVELHRLGKKTDPSVDGLRGNRPGAQTDSDLRTV
jgi:hypothetical protein